MEKTPRYSVIIPVYNAEKTLFRCVNSLLNQGYSDAEIILINDGSSDNSGIICKKFAESSRQIIYIDKKNGGVSSARNAGLDVASGKYILFVDSDDAVTENYFMQLDLLDSHTEYDFLWFSYGCVSREKTSVRLLKADSGQTALQCAEMFSQALCNKSINSPCNKRYKKQIIKDISLQFDEQLSIGEDKVFNLQYALACCNYLVSDKVLYTVYTDSEQSLSRGIRQDLSQQFQRLDDKILSVIGSYQMTEEMRRKYFEAVMFLKLRSVYSDAKRMHAMNVADSATRKIEIRNICFDICRKKNVFPRNWYSFLMWIPVRFRLVFVIDLVGRMLAR